MNSLSIQVLGEEYTGSLRAMDIGIFTRVCPPKRSFDKLSPRPTRRRAIRPLL